MAGIEAVPVSTSVKDGDLQERYHRLVELAPDGILIHDGERIVMANAAAMRLAGAVRRDELVGRPIETFLSPPYLKGLAEQLVGGREPDPTAAAARDTFRRLDGAEIPVEVTAIPFVEEGRPAAHLVIRDVTERVAAQAAALHAEAQKLATVRTLAGGVAHEINNTMMVALGFSQLLLRDARIPGDLLDDVKQIQRAADRAAAVAKQLLSYSRRAAPKPRAIALDVTLREMLPMVERLLGDGQHLVTTLACPGSVWMDASHLEQMVVNLVLNARDAMSAGGTLTLATSQQELTGDDARYRAGECPVPTGWYGVLAIRDSGIGMDEATMAHIFEPFFTTKPVGLGTGLGLSVLQGLLEQDGGYITVESAPGAGTAFTLHFPLLAAASSIEEEVQTPDVGSGLLAGATVLVVDDDPGVREVAIRSLEDSGCHVLEAVDGAGALEVLGRRGPPDLVLTDVLMRGMGGAELAGQLRARWPVLPILFMSGYPEEHLRRIGALEDTGGVLEKPLLPERLVRSVYAALAHRAG